MLALSHIREHVELFEDGVAPIAHHVLFGFVDHVEGLLPHDHVPFEEPLLLRIDLVTVELAIVFKRAPICIWWQL